MALRWAVVGTGNMADLFLSDSRAVENGQFIAVCSRSEVSANRFADKHQLAIRETSLETLLQHSEIDAVYIASPHSQHALQARQVLAAGKHVLIEKPMALSHEETTTVFAEARQAQRFCAEALWTKFLPTFQNLMHQIAEGRIGEVRHVQANFGFANDLSQTDSRLLDPNQAGGALLDIGLYPLLLPLSLWGLPDELEGLVDFAGTQVDIVGDWILRYKEGQSATISYRFDAMMPMKAVISGTKGWVELEAPFFAGQSLLWGVHGQPAVTETVPLKNRGWGIEFEAVNRAILAGELEAPEHTAADSLALAELLTRCRQQHGPRYPFE